MRKDENGDIIYVGLIATMKIQTAGSGNGKPKEPDMNNRILSEINGLCEELRAFIIAQSEVNRRQDEFNHKLEIKIETEVKKVKDELEIKIETEVKKVKDDLEAKIETEVKNVKVNIEAKIETEVKKVKDELDSVILANNLKTK